MIWIVLTSAIPGSRKSRIKSTTEFDATKSNTIRGWMHRNLIQFLQLKLQ